MAIKKCFFIFCLFVSIAIISESQNKKTIEVDNPMHVDVKTHIKKIQLPPGFQIQSLAENVQSARSMTLGSNGTLFVGTRYDDKGAPGKFMR